MYSHYFYWQYISAPLWLLNFFLTLHRALLQMFSVRIMVTTLFAHWRRDKVAYRQGTISGLWHALSWNIISRTVGLIVRSVILICWSISAVILSLLAAGLFISFVLAPAFALATIVYGLALIVGGG